MPTLELSPLEIWQLRELTRTGNGRVVHRALRVLWRAEGVTTRQIGERLDCPPDTVTVWLERYRTLGLAGLQDAPRSSRPPQPDAPDCEEWAADLEQAPPEEDRPCACWTLDQLRTVLLGVMARSFCPETLRRTV